MGQGKWKPALLDPSNNVCQEKKKFLTQDSVHQARRDEMSFLQASSQESGIKSEGVILNVGMGEGEVNQTAELKQRDD